MPLTDRDMNGEMRIVYHHVDLGTVIEYFVNGFDRDVWDYEWFCDTAKGKVIFRLFVEENKTEEEG